MEAIIISIMNKFGYLGIMFLIAIENIFPPIPSEIILTFGGFMTSSTRLTVVGVIIFSTIGSMLGAILLYFIGKILNKERLKKMISGKLGKLLRLKESDIDKADNWFDTKGNKTVFFCRFIPIVRSLISIPAGMSEMPFIKFLLYSLFGTVIWNSVLTILGSIAGDNWGAIASFIGRYASITLFLLVILIVVFIIIFYKKKKRDDDYNTFKIDNK